MEVKFWAGGGVAAAVQWIFWSKYAPELAGVMKPENKMRELQVGDYLNILVARTSDLH